ACLFFCSFEAGAGGEKRRSFLEI
ncbi:hypothetical protein CCACVL1_00254, partial [Corchorus capsularis]